MSAAKTILNQKALRVTQARLSVVNAFIDRGIALSEPDLEAAIGDSCDRVTIYRTLSTFLESGVVHKVMDDGGALKYALCGQGCAEDEVHAHDHVHFKCQQCGETTCLDHVPVPTMKLPHGFAAREFNVLISGLCPKCKAA